VGTRSKFEATSSGLPYSGLLVIGGRAPIRPPDLGFDRFQPLIFSLEFVTRDAVVGEDGDLLRRLPLPKTLKGTILDPQPLEIAGNDGDISANRSALFGLTRER
jgi:hypothetical protein